MRSCSIAIMLLASLSTVVFAQNTRQPAVQVELNHEKPLHLRVTLRSGSATTATFYRADLPWGYRYSMVFVVARPNGDPIDLELPVSGPGPTKVSVRPGEVLTGDVDLRVCHRRPKFAEEIRPATVLGTQVSRRVAHSTLVRRIGSYSSTEMTDAV
jgi:hypothetical protein